MGLSRKSTLITLCLLVFLLLATLLSLFLGARSIAPIKVVSYLMNHSIGIDESAVLGQRLMRTIWGIIIGGAISLAGAGMQGITRNPLGDPGILGVNAGASFAVVTGIVFFGAQVTGTFTILALIGSALAAVLVYALASIGRGGATPVKLALMGAALTAAFGSLTSAFILQNQNSLDTLRKWQVGSIGGANWDALQPTLPVIILGAVIVLLGAKTINNFALGDDMATALGERVGFKRLILFIGITLLIGTAVALCGPIAFLGLMAPHAVRSIIGTDYRILLPLSAIFGAGLLILADTVGRILLPPQEIEVGVTMVLLGVPVFIYLIRRHRAVEL